MKMSRRLLLRLIATTGTLLCSLLLLGMTTMAWIAMNRVNDAHGMEMQMDVTSNLIIAKRAEDLSLKPTDSGASGVQEMFRIQYTEPREEMIPSTLDWNVGKATGLKYVTNTWDVEFDSGLIKSGKSLAFEAVPSATDSPYYVDFHAWIASTEKAMTNVKLVITMKSGTIAATDPHLNAATIAVYQDSVASGNLKGTISAAGQFTDSIVVTLPDNTVPLCTSGSLHFVVRCYFDGALKETDSKTYIKSSTINANDVAMKVTFRAEEIS